MKGFLAEIALFGAIFFCPVAALAQGLESVVEQMVADGASQAEIEDYLQQAEERSHSKINLNRAPRATLEGSGLFTPFQIASLLDYRKDYGEILSLEELALVDGFSTAFVRSVAPYVTLFSAAGACKELLQIRSRFKYRGGEKGVHQYNRLLLEAGSVKAGFLAESDPGEKVLCDYLGGYLAYCNGRIEALAGDYTACFGQGLALWNAFSMASASQPASLLRRPKGITPYRSADECRALRGVALKYCFKSGLESSLMVSAAGVDARQEKDGYTSIIKTGYHRTLYEKGAKHSMREYLLGGNLTYQGDRFRVGLTAVAYSYDKPNARKQAPYNQYQMYDGWMGDLAADAVYSAGHWRLFAEAALSATLRGAVVAGAVWTPSFNFEGAALLRCYDKGYIALHAGAYSTISSVSNQMGAAVALMCRPVRDLLVTSFTEVVHYPWVRYRIDAPSTAIYEKVKAEYVLGAITISLQDNYVFQSYDFSHKHSLKGTARLASQGWKCSLAAGVTVVSRGEESVVGGAAALSVTKSFAGGRWSAMASASYYDAKDYDARVYIYEGDLPGSFTLQYYYGKGIAARCLVKVKAGRHTALSAIVVASAHLEARLQADINF